MARLCRWLPLLTAGALLAGMALGYSPQFWAAVGLLLLCPLVCLVLYFQSRETERQVADVERGRQRLP